VFDQLCTFRNFFLLLTKSSASTSPLLDLLIKPVYTSDWPTYESSGTSVLAIIHFKCNPSQTNSLLLSPSLSLHYPSHNGVCSAQTMKSITNPKKEILCFKQHVKQTWKERERERESTIDGQIGPFGPLFRTLFKGN
jgi:hypothetical protein